MGAPGSVWVSPSSPQRILGACIDAWGSVSTRWGPCPLPHHETAPQSGSSLPHSFAILAPIISDPFQQLLCDVFPSSRVSHPSSLRDREPLRLGGGRTCLPHPAPTAPGLPRSVASPLAGWAAPVSAEGTPPCLAPLPHPRPQAPSCLAGRPPWTFENLTAAASSPLMGLHPPLAS